MTILLSLEAVQLRPRILSTACRTDAESAERRPAPETEEDSRVKAAAAAAIVAAAYAR